MASTLLIKSHRCFRISKILATINSTGQCPYPVAKSFPASYSTTVSPPENHRVFISFRGDELRCNFYSHLIDALNRHGIKYFEDKGEERGKDLKHIFVRIEESRIGLVIFSTRYSESKWCMRELLKMKKRANEGKLKIIPIFFKVDASEVKSPTRESEFGRNFWRLMETSDRTDPIQEWREALECTSNKMGLSLKDKSSEADFVKEIVKEVERVAIRLKEEESHGEIPERIMKDKNEELQLSICEIPERIMKDKNEELQLSICEIPHFRSYKTIKP